MSFKQHNQSSKQQKWQQSPQASTQSQQQQQQQVTPQTPQTPQQQFPTQSFQPQSQQVNSPRVDAQKRAEHQFFNKMPDINSVEGDLMKLLNEFTNTSLQKYGTDEVHEKLFKKMDAIREKQEKIARKHFEQETILTDSKVEGEDHKAQSMRNLEELTTQLEELNSSIHELHDFKLD